LVIIAWYSRDNFYRIRQIEPDGGGLHETFEEWLEEAQQTVLKIAATGVRIERVDIDPDALLAYCRASNIKCDEQARAGFAHVLASARHATKQ
jgi:hypothetical protein